MPKLMPTGFASKVYDVLEKHCGAPPSEGAAFVQHFEAAPNDSPTTEWRFGGNFGFGGKFRWPRCTVDAYPENMTPAIAEAKLRADAELDQLAKEMLVHEAGR